MKKISMKIEHVAIWTNDLERLKSFYEQYFGAKSNELYHNKSKNFRSYFLSFGDGARLELMQISAIPENQNDPGQQAAGLTHLAFSTGSETEVDSLTEKLVQAGYQKLDGPRRTGDGYYESCISDPDGNRIELTV